MIKDDVLVFDCVAHPFNFDPSNALGQAGELFNNHLYAFHQVLTPEDEARLSPEEFLKEWSTEQISRMVFDESDTDMLVAMPLPLTDLFRDGLSPWERCVCNRFSLTNNGSTPEYPVCLRGPSRPHVHLEQHHLVDVMTFFGGKVVEIFGHQSGLVFEESLSVAL
jgi:hypothetical protein